MFRYFFIVVILSGLVSTISNGQKSSDRLENYKPCSSVITKIGLVIDYKSRVGKEQKIAIEMAVQDHMAFDSSSSSKNCAKLDLRMRDSEGNPAIATASAIDLIRNDQVRAIVGTLNSHEVALIYESTHHKVNDYKPPFISLSSPAITNPSEPFSSPPILFQISSDVVSLSQCIAALIGHFKWRKVTAVYEHDTNYGFSVPLTFLSDSLQKVNSEIEHHKGFPSLTLLSDEDRGKVVEEELRKLKSNSNRVFVVFHFPLPSVLLLFESAKRLGMMEKGFVWIISDEIASLLDSVDSSFKHKNMHGVIGIKTSFDDTTKKFKKFKKRFRRLYGSQYPEEEENSSPSIFALQAYDSINAIAKSSIGDHHRVSLSEKLSFQGLAGEIGFKNNGLLAKSPTFEVVNVVGKSYQTVAYWSELHGFSKTVDDHSSEEGFEFSIHWSGGSRNVPEGRALIGEDRPLKVVVPASGAFHLFVQASYNQEKNVTDVSGFSIDVFKAVMRSLPYHLQYSFFSFNGTYDQMVQLVHDKVYDISVGDISIRADRFKYVEFTQPYLNSGLTMIVEVEPDRRGEKWMFLEAFSRKMWAQFFFIHFTICCVVCIIEIYHGQNDQLQGFGVMLWFSVTTLFYAQREPLTCNLARIVLAPWLFTVLVVGASFTASLSSMLTVSQIRPSVLDIDTLLRTNAPVGCNGKSFIVGYLIDTLKFRRENVRNISSMDDYPGAFERGDIKAAFFLEPHADVFLARNCNGFVKACPTHKLGGLGFAVQKESELAIHLSKAIIEAVESREVERLQKDMFSSFNCTSPSIRLGTGPIGPEPFSGLFSISGFICAFAFLILVALRTFMLLNEALSLQMKAKLMNMGFWRWATRKKLPNVT